MFAISCCLVSNKDTIFVISSDRKILSAEISSDMMDRESISVSFPQVTFDVRIGLSGQSLWKSQFYEEEFPFVEAPWLQITICVPLICKNETILFQSLSLFID